MSKCSNYRRFSFHADPSVIADLDRFAYLLGDSRSFCIRQAILEYLYSDYVREILSSPDDSANGFAHVTDYFVDSSSYDLFADVE